MFFLRDFTFINIIHGLAGLKVLTQLMMGSRAVIFAL